MLGFDWVDHADGAATLCKPELPAGGRDLRGLSHDPLLSFGVGYSTMLESRQRDSRDSSANG